MSDSPRRTLRHAILRARNERIAKDRDERLPTVIYMSQEAMDAVLMDSDPGETFTMDFEGKAFLGIPMLVDPALAGGARLEWPA